MSPYRDAIKVHAYTDDAGLTLFAVDFGDRVLKFGAYITNFELNTEAYEDVGVFDSFRRMIPGNQTISLEASVVRPAVYEHRAPARQLGAQAKEIGPARKELGSGSD